MKRVNEEKYLKAFFGKSAEYYLTKYNEYHEKNTLFPFSVPAFFLNIFWFLYRKLYLEFFIIMIIIALIPSISPWQNMVNIMILVCLGFLGNNLYIKKGDSIIKKVIASTENEDARIKRLQTKGGTSWVPFILVLLIVVTTAVFVNS